MTVAAFASSPAALAVLAVRIHSQEPRLLARAARSLTGGAARGLARRAEGVSPALGLLVRCAAQAQGCAVAQSCAPAGALMRRVRNQARCAALGLGRARSAVRMTQLRALTLRQNLLPSIA